ncbi:hypothetical protein A2422_03995 [Candidatus Woesebacteria bacterium RIFOXYC1_FULL_31_51]|uniref:Integral membrane protein n=1 Tax=Candidatus Woesebacteria bacterium GW2011_GWC2_31_9 TaxID=1618586 RepID=A0A0F9YKJ8_9BACT|nr:MAG: hypothetical protein UR17_C0001G0304 [Candidatus Woesebacteria bacterium GW2011_GWF1_31_35]KKP23202.1 MAG: hypothetical protein UR11_C0001G0176 [Candidatus Woesebacteria bacterium GW2011_GWC1_30_29]KKP26890.1 MAG: hypothetical protein UR13_C0002G0125 [Candidatus Woesebacteria bacterium GW2011_GWD1_31_12]KKP27464.1 MAG: hypothetical protein UR16_C0003G0124 [Candidatus Woesebacteria bacterium GW2011_GWB1_31_29]KKP31122.1 MAG: hypothetical protein UR20_C0043G0005 [Candidatus Woesebacteria 
MNKLAIDIGTTFLGTGSKLTDPTNIGNYISAIITGAISIAGVILLFLLIMGGIGMIAGAGSDSPEKIEKGKKAVTSALIGFIVVFMSYWIVKLIESITGLNLLGISKK